MQKNATATMKKMEEDKETASCLEESTFQALLKIEAEGKYSKGEAITRAFC